MKCGKCEHDVFKIDERGCELCENNGVWDELTQKYTYPERTDDDRTQAGEDGECEMGHTWDNGCHLYTCACCGWQSHYPTVDV